MSTIRDTMLTTWEKSKDRLTPEELRQISGLSETAEFVAGNLRRVVEGIGCYVLNDDTNTTKVGTFQDPDGLSTLLFSIASQVDLIEGLIHVSAEADFRLQEQKSTNKGAGVKV